MSWLRPRILLMLLLNTGLAAAVGYAWRLGEAQIEEPARLTVVPLELPSLADLNSVSMHAVEVATIRDRAVFYSQRVFYQPPPPPVQIAIPDFQLDGILALPNGRHVAFVRRLGSQSSQSVHVGEEIEGWRVQQIEPTRVVISHDGQVSELVPPKSATTLGLMRSVARAPVPITHKGVSVLGKATSMAVRTAAAPPSFESRNYRPPGH